jgi:hypothetical protein
LEDREVLIRGLAVLAATTSTFIVGSAAVADTTVGADLTPVNGSHTHGTATLTAREDGSLTVVIRARGLVPGQPHAQHIHGSAEGGHAMCPTQANDTNGDGVLTNEEATGEYGTITMSLTTRGGASAKDGLALDRMPVADAQGRLTYRRTFAPDLVPGALLDQLSHVHVVIHGIDANNNDRYDVDGLGVSTFARNLGVPGVPEEATDPASCGVVTGAEAPTMPRGGPETGVGPPDVAADEGVGRTVLGTGLLAGAAALLVLSLTRRAAGRRTDG